MVFLEGLSHPMSVRSISQQAFVVGEGDEDGDADATSEFDHGSEVGARTSPPSSYDGKGSGKDLRSIASTLLAQWPGYLTPVRATAAIASLCGLVVVLAVSLAVLVGLYVATFPKYEVCRSPQCLRTATLFLKTMDASVDPCEDFHRFACGNWIADTASAVSVPMFDHTTIMRDRIVGRLRLIAESITDNDIDILQQVKRMYDSCVDTDTIEDDGFGDLVEFVTELVPFDGNATSSHGPKRPSLAAVLGRIRRRTDQNYLFDFSVDPDYMNASVNTIMVDQPDLVISSDQLADDGILREYRKVMGQILGRISAQFPNNSLFAAMAAPEGQERIVELDTRLAAVQTDDTLRSKPQMNNLVTLRQLNLLFSGTSIDGPVKDAPKEVLRFRRKRAAEKGRSHALLFDWVEYFNTLFEGVAEFDEDSAIIVNDLPYLRAFAALLRNTSRHDLDMYLGWQLVYSLGKDVSSEVAAPLDAFTMKLDGDESRPNRHTQCVTLLDDTLPFTLTHKYVLRYVNASVIAETHEMVANIVRAFKASVTRLEWMDENTVARAILKANHVRAYIGFPDWLRNPAAVEAYYAGLTFGPSFFRNVVAMLAWVAEAELLTYRQAVDGSWSSSTDSPAEADAWYDDELNAITFPSGFLQNPFVGMGLRATDYGALGSVVGHELTHGFDTTGRYSDEVGRLNAWWSMDTLQRFLGRAACFVAQYSAYRLPELDNLLGASAHVNGLQTLAENIADNGGIRGALAAYRLYVAEARGGEPEARLPGLEEYSPEQIFFMAFGQSWCSYMNPISLANMLQSNVHSPAQFRVIGALSNFDEFAHVWQCPAGARMNPPHKCVLW